MNSLPTKIKKEEEWEPIEHIYHALRNQQRSLCIQKYVALPPAPRVGRAPAVVALRAERHTPARCAERPAGRAGADRARGLALSALGFAPACVGGLSGEAAQQAWGVQRGRRACHVVRARSVTVRVRIELGHKRVGDDERGRGCCESARRTLDLAEEGESGEHCNRITSRVQRARDWLRRQRQTRRRRVRGRRQWGYMHGGEAAELG